MASYQPYLSTYGVDKLKQQEIQLAVHYGLGRLIAIKQLASYRFVANCKSAAQDISIIELQNFYFCVQLVQVFTKPHFSIDSQHLTHSNDVITCLLTEQNLIELAVANAAGWWMIAISNGLLVSFLFIIVISTSCSNFKFF